MESIKEESAPPLPDDDLDMIEIRKSSGSKRVLSQDDRSDEEADQSYYHTENIAQSVLFNSCLGSALDDLQQQLLSVKSDRKSTVRTANELTSQLQSLICRMENVLTTHNEPLHLHSQSAVVHDERLDRLETNDVVLDAQANSQSQLVRDSFQQVEQIASGHQQTLDSRTSHATPGNVPLIMLFMMRGLGRIIKRKNENVLLLC